MTGLVFIDTLRLSLAQQATLTAAAGIYLTQPLTARTLTAAQIILLTGFWQTPTLLDTRLLLNEAAALRGASWAGFLGELGLRNYLSLQSPFYSFFVSRWPLFGAQQVLLTAWAMLCAGLLTALYGERARLLLAAPLWGLMSTQPGNDLLLLGALLSAVRLQHLGHRRSAAVVYGLTWWIKPLTLLTLPVMAARLQGWTLASVALWALYVAWSRQWLFGHLQWRFLLHQLCLY